MTVHELSRDEIRELKERYLIELANEGKYAEVLGVDWDAPSWGEMAAADEIVPDDVIFYNYEDIDFVPDDFFCNRMMVES
jgi:hypothetical protein